MTDLSDLSLNRDWVAMQLAEEARLDPRPAWLARRERGIACSDLPAVWLALGLATPTERAAAAGYIKAQAQALHDSKAWRSFARDPPKVVKVGRERERELFRRWHARLESGAVVDDPAELDVDPSTLINLEAHEAVMRLLPIVDRYEPRLVDSTDGVALSRRSRGLVVIQGKCIAGSCAELPWYWRLAVQGQIAVTDAEFGVVICGEEWAHGGIDFAAKRLRAFAVLRDEAVHAQIRAAVRDARVDVLLER